VRQICPNVAELEFFSRFNEPLDRVDLPQTITHLRFGARFDKSLRNVKLPRSLTHLAFDGRVSIKELEAITFPPSIQQLSLTTLYFDDDDIKQSKMLTSRIPRIVLVPF
jgi:hypothetical protein